MADNPSAKEAKKGVKEFGQWLLIGGCFLVLFALAAVAVANTV